MGNQSAAQRNAGGPETCKSAVGLMPVVRIPVMSDDPPIPPQQRHDAPDPDRPYVVMSPLMPLALALTLASVSLLYFTLNAFAVVAALSGFVAAVTNTPRLLRARSLVALERRLMRRAKRRRERRLRRWQYIDRAAVWAGHAVEVLFGFGALVLVAAAFALVLSGPAGAIARAGLALVGLSLLLALALTFVVILYAQLKGDEASGPLHFHRVAGLANWMERHPEATDDIQLWSLLLALLFTVAAFITEAVL